MADPVSILGTVVGVASLAIQVTETLRNYWKDASNFQTQVAQILGDTQQLSEILRRLQEFLERDPTKLSRLFTATSTLYSAGICCEIRLVTLMENLRKELEGSKKRKMLKALKWPFKVEETQKLSMELRGYAQTFQFALTLDGCQLLLQTSEEVSHRLQSLASLSTSTKQQTEDIASVINAISSLPQTTYAIRKGVEKLEARAEVVEEEQALHWLGSDLASAKHQNIKKSRLANTGEWIFSVDAYTQWKNGMASILWGQGKPGAGKSVLMSCVVDRLTDEASHDECVAFFYCEYSQSIEAQTALTIVTSFIYQLVLQLGSVPVELIHTYRHHLRRSTRPDLQESIELLQKIIGKFSRTWLLIDAFDELEPNSKDDLMEVVQILKDSTRFFITSRPQSIDNFEVEENTLRCTLSAQEEDLTAFIRSRMSRAAIASRRVRESPGWDSFVYDTVEKLVRIADGMFILVTLQLEMLLRPRTLVEMRKSLDNISNKLDDFYAATLDRIKARESDMALKVLSWLVKHLRPLSLNELCEALAVEYSTTSINSDAIIYKDDLLEMSCGLITIDENEILSLAHATVHEFLSSRLDNIDQFDSIIAKTCLCYLNFETFCQQAAEEPSPPTFLDPEHDIPIGGYKALFSNNKYDRRVRQHPFLPYAARYWCDHYSQSSKSEELTNLALKLITGLNAPAMLQAYSTNKSIRMDGLNPLHIVALLGILPLAEFLIAQAALEAQKYNKQSFQYSFERLVDSQSAFGNTPLLYAVQHKHFAIAEALLHTKAVNPSIMDNTIIRWALTWKNEELLRLMVQMPRFNRQLARRQFGKRIEMYLEEDSKDETNKKFYESIGYPGVTIPKS